MELIVRAYVYNYEIQFYLIFELYSSMKNKEKHKEIVICEDLYDDLKIAN